MYVMISASLATFLSFVETLMLCFLTGMKNVLNSFSSYDSGTYGAYPFIILSVTLAF